MKPMVKSPKRLGLRGDDEGVFSPRGDKAGPKGPYGRGFGVDPNDDMEFTGGPDTADTPNPGEDSLSRELRRLLKKFKPTQRHQTILEDG